MSGDLERLFGELAAKVLTSGDDGLALAAATLPRPPASRRTKRTS
jgi:hypothetical protein